MGVGLSPSTLRRIKALREFRIRIILRALMALTALRSFIGIRAFRKLYISIRYYTKPMEALEPLGGPKLNATKLEEEPRGSTWGHEERQEPEGARKTEEEPGGATWGHEERQGPEGVRKNQDEPVGAKRVQWELDGRTETDCNQGGDLRKSTSHKKNECYIRPSSFPKWFPMGSTN